VNRFIAAAVLLLAVSFGVSAPAAADQSDHPEHPPHPARPVPSPPSETPPDVPLGLLNPYRLGARSHNGGI
jgi:hypothetical protein